MAHDHGWPIVIFSRRTRRVVRRTTTLVGAAGMAGAAFVGGIAVGKRGGSERKRARGPSWWHR
jgi:hypothetical protein